MEPQTKGKWGLLVLAVMLVAIPAVAAQSSDNIGLISASGTYTHELQASAMKQILPSGGVSAGTSTSATGCTEPGEFQSNPGGSRGFRFREGELNRGCGEALWIVEVPEGATRIVVEFDANRVLENFGTSNVPNKNRQALHLHNAKGTIVQENPYFDDTSGEELSLTHFVSQFEIPPESKTVQVGWYFSDESDAAAVLTFRESFSATIRDPIVYFPDVPVSQDIVQASLISTELQGNELIETLEIRYNHHVAHDSHLSELQFAFQGTLELEKAVDPEGKPVARDNILVTVANGNSVIRITNLLASSEPGEYKLQLTRVDPSGYSTFFPLLLGTIAGPFILGILTASASGKYLSLATREKRADAQQSRFILIGFVALFLSLVLATILVGYSRMIVVPPSGLQLAVYVGFLLLLAAMFVLRDHIIRGTKEAVQEAALTSRARQAERERLQQSNKDLEGFAYIASHDLQEPLRRVHGYADLLEEEESSRLSPEGIRYLNTIREGATHMENLVRDLLALSRASGSKLPKTQVKIADAIEIAKQDLETRIRDRKAIIQVSVSGSVLAHQDTLARLFQNLIGNAIKFTPKGRKPVVRVSTSHSIGNELCIQIADNGIGISQEYQEQIFDTFTRLHSTEDYEGTGVGLAICKRIVEQLGGRISIESDGKMGTTFSVFLPKS